MSGQLCWLSGAPRGGGRLGPPSSSHPPPLSSPTEAQDPVSLSPDLTQALSQSPLELGPAVKAPPHPTCPLPVSCPRSEGAQPCSRPRRGHTDNQDSALRSVAPRGTEVPVHTTHWTRVETGAQRGAGTCLRSHSSTVLSSDLGPQTSTGSPCHAFGVRLKPPSRNAPRDLVVPRPEGGTWFNFPLPPPR